MLISRHVLDMQVGLFSRFESLAYGWYLGPYVSVRSPSELCVLEGGVNGEGRKNIWQG